MEALIYDELLPDGRRIQIGTASWASKPLEVELAGGDTSVRCYYKNSAGKFRRTSPEISVRDLIDLVEAIAKSRRFLPECEKIKEALAK